MLVAQANTGFQDGRFVTGVCPRDTNAELKRTEPPPQRWDFYYTARNKDIYEF